VWCSEPDSALERLDTTQTGRGPLPIAAIRRGKKIHQKTNPAEAGSM
jgi:hypothetical protein